MSQDANERLPTLSKALLLPLIPFCLLGFLNGLFVVCGGQIMKRSMSKGSLVSFLGDTAKQRKMAFDMTRVFCYSVLQLVFQVGFSTKDPRNPDPCFQLVLMLGFTPWKSVRYSQLLSITVFDIFYFYKTPFLW